MHPHSLIRHPTVKLAGAIILGVVAVAVVFLLGFDFKGFAERRASAALGRPVTIGDLHLQLFPLEVVIADLNVADVVITTQDSQKPPSNKPPFMKAEHVDAAVAFWRLLVGDVLFKRLAIENAVARIERRPDGSLSWDVNDPDTKTEVAEKPSLPEIRDLRLKGVQLLYRDDTNKTRLTLRFDTTDAADGKEPTLLVKGDGTYQGQPSTLTATGGSILKLRDAETPYPVDAKLVSGATTILVKGTVLDPITIAGLNINLTAKGEGAADLYRVAGIALPSTPAYVIESHLDSEGARWIFKNLHWTMGKSDFLGELVWDVSDKTPLLTGKLDAKVVALDDLGGFIGAAPGNREAPVEEKREAAERERGKRVTAPEPEQSVAAELVIPDQTIDLEKLNSMNAKVQLSAQKVIEAGFPIDTFKTEVVLQTGMLSLKPLVFTADAGKVTINLTIDGRASPAKTTVDATLQGFPLQRIVGKTGGDNTSWGGIGGLAMGGGQLSLFIVELMGVDIAEALGIILTKDRPTQIRCVVGDFALDRGKMTARTMVADTNDTIFRGNGSIDLGREVMDMRIHAKPKDVSPVTLRSKILLTGTFADPHIGPDPKGLILQGAAAVALGVLLTPLGSLIALIDPGGGKDANCQELFKEAAK